MDNNVIKGGRTSNVPHLWRGLLPTQFPPSVSQKLSHICITIRTYGPRGALGHRMQHGTWPDHYAVSADSHSHMVLLRVHLRVFSGDVGRE